MKVLLTSFMTGQNVRNALIALHKADCLHSFHNRLFFTKHQFWHYLVKINYLNRDCR